MKRTRKILFQKIRSGSTYNASNNEVTKAIVQTCQSINVHIKKLKFTDDRDKCSILKVKCTKEEYIALVSDLAYDTIGIRLIRIKP